MNEPVEVLRKEVQQRIHMANSQGGWEGSHTDFKKELGSKPRELARVLRHILAFANTPRRTDAYIIFGLEEDKSRRLFRHAGVGESGFPLKETLDEIIRTYTKLKDVFVDDAFLVDGKRTPYVAIPLQYGGPYTLTKPYPGLDTGTVYCRYGSLSAPATDRDQQRMEQSWDEWFVDCRYAENATTLLGALQKRFPTATSFRDTGSFIRFTYNSNVADEFGCHTTPVLVHAYSGLDALGPESVETLRQDDSDPYIASRKLIAARFAPMTQELATQCGVHCHPLVDIYFVNDSYAILCREFLRRWEDDRTRMHLNFIIDLDYRSSREKGKQCRSILSFLEYELRSNDRTAIVVHGDFGCGKTTTANELVAQLSREYLRGNFDIPKVLYLDVNNMDIKSRRDECIESQLLRLRISREHVDRLVAMVRDDEIHLVFDGVDEMARPYTTGGRKEVMEILRDRGNRSAAAYFVRSSYFPEMNDMLRQFGLVASHDLERGEPRIVITELLHLRDEQVNKYIDDRLGREQGAELRRKLTKLKLADFLRDPLITAILVEYGLDGIDAASEGTVKALFLANLVRRLVNREQEKRARHGALAENIQLFLKVLRSVAFSMLSRGLSTLSPVQLEKFVERALDNPTTMPDLVDAFRTMSWIHRGEGGQLGFRHEVLTVVCAAEHICAALEKRALLDLLDWQEAAHLADVTCQYAGRVLTANSALGAAAILGSDPPMNVRQLVTRVFEDASGRTLEIKQRENLELNDVANICRALAKYPQLISTCSNVLLQSLGTNRFVHIATPLAYLLGKNESKETVQGAIELLEFEVGKKTKGAQKRRFTDLLVEIKQDPSTLTEKMLLKELGISLSELVDSVNYQTLFERIEAETKNKKTAIHQYADRTLRAIEGDRQRRDAGVQEQQGKARARRKYITAG